MSTRLVMLGLLRERPLYGYEIKHIIEEHMGDWTNIAFGSIYFALGKLAEEGFIEQVAVEQEGRRPSRSVYQITEEGRDEFLRLLREVWGGLAVVDGVISTAVHEVRARPDRGAGRTGVSAGAAARRPSPARTRPGRGGRDPGATCSGVYGAPGGLRSRIRARIESVTHLASPQAPDRQAL